MNIQQKCTPTFVGENQLKSLAKPNDFRTENQNRERGCSC
jgi:hypothetical protein